MIMLAFSLEHCCDGQLGHPLLKDAIIIFFSFSRLLLLLFIGRLNALHHLCLVQRQSVLCHDGENLELNKQIMGNILVKNTLRPLPRQLQGSSDPQGWLLRPNSPYRHGHLG